jgi:ABC-2 type transport system ATP-binding protein
VEVPTGVLLPELAGVVELRQDGHLAVATTNAFAADMPQMYEAVGARVHGVERMTLEEIFVASVQHSREGAQA